MQNWLKFGEHGEKEIGFEVRRGNVAIYVLTDPRDNTVRYVGATGHPATRLAHHLATVNGGDKYAWILDLGNSGLSPTMRIVASTDSESARSMERFWVEFYLSKKGSLFNEKNVPYFARPSVSNALISPDLLREIVFRADSDRRTVMSVLRGEGTPKGKRASGARSRVARVMAEMGIEPAVPMSLAIPERNLDTEVGHGLS